MNKTKIAGGCLVLVFVIVLGVVLVADSSLRAYPADQELLIAAYEEPGIVISETAGYFKIESKQNQSGRGETVGVVFYPGGLVTPQSYIDPLVKLLTSAIRQGTKMQIFITKPPLNLAVLDYDAAGRIISAENEIGNWVVGGHSLGGAMACRYAKGQLAAQVGNELQTGAEGQAGREDLVESENMAMAEKPEKKGVSGLFLLAAYCDEDISSSRLPVITIYGSNDQVLNTDLLTTYSKNLPEGSNMLEITGMNHAQFGSYGAQKQDGPAQISWQAAQDNWIAKLTSWIERDVI